MIHTGKIEKHTMIDDGAVVANPEKFFKWSCSCGEKEELIETYSIADNRLDSHMRSHFSEARRVPLTSSVPEFCTGDFVRCTVTHREGKVTDPHLDGARILVSFEGEPPVRHPIDTLEPGSPHAHVREDPQDVIERPPDRDATHDVRHTVPSSQGNPESDQTQRLIAIIDAPINPGIGTMRYVESRWDLFNDDELQYFFGDPSDTGLWENEKLREEGEAQLRRRGLPTPEDK
jgi:hypothetical protein